MWDLRASPAGTRGSGQPCPGAISLEAQRWRSAATPQSAARMGPPDARMGKPRPSSPPLSGASAGHHRSLCHLKTPEGCCHLFNELNGLCKVLVGDALLLPFPRAHRSGRVCYTACSSNTKGSPGTTSTFHSSGKPNSKVLCISRHKRQAAFATLAISYLEIREKPWVLQHTMSWDRPWRPCEGTPVTCCAQEGTPHPSPFLWDWLNWL